MNNPETREIFGTSQWQHWGKTHATLENNIGTRQMQHWGKTNATLENNIGTRQMQH